MSTKVRIEAIAFDAGTQIRAAINEQVVADYAERMSEGILFPPIVLFHDGNTHYLADGFHRYMASKRVGFTDIAADVQPGTKDDALWFALGANKANGQRMTDADKKHALTLAVSVFPNKSMRQLAEQVGCSSTYASRIRAEVQTGLQPVDRVIGSDGNSYPASRTARQSLREAAEKLLRAGKSTAAIRAEVGIGRDAVMQMRRDLSMGVDKSRDAINERQRQMRDLAASGHTSRQIAAHLGLGEDALRVNLKKLGIDVPADKAIRGTHRHDSNRILDRIAIDAENLSEGVNLIEFADLDGDRFGDWIDSLMASKLTIEALIKRLLKERKRHGEAA